MLTQVLTALHALVLASLVYTKSIAIGPLIVLSGFLGVVQGFDWPTRQSLVVHLVDGPANLANAIALNSTVYNLARIAGPSVAGAIIAVGGGSFCFAVPAVGSLLAVVSMSQVCIPVLPHREVKLDFVREFRAGARYAWDEPVIRCGLALIALASGCIMPYVTLLPVFAAEVFGGGAKLFGLLASAPAVGAVTAGLVLASRRRRTALHRQVTQSMRLGARLLLGGNPLPGPGYFYAPTVLTDVRPGMAAYAEEVFGPVAAIIPVRDEAEAIAVANDSAFGLGATIFTQDRSRARQIAQELDCGLIFVNAYARSDLHLPFGGTKGSGHGRELGIWGLRSFVKPKTVWVS